MDRRRISHPSKLSPNTSVENKSIYDFKHLSHLPHTVSKPFTDGVVFLSKLNKAKYKFNRQHMSDYISNYLKGKTSYVSRRDEVGISIAKNDHLALLNKIERKAKFQHRKRC